jgi:hypothetical protein
MKIGGPGISCDMKSTRTQALGIPFGTARARLLRNLLYEFACRLGLDDCYRCGEKIESAEVFSVEHKEPWLDSPNPLGVYLELDNIAFSHTNCNSGARRPLFKHGTTSGFARGCRCLSCVEAKRNYNSDFMARWRADGKDKSRKNFQGA